MDQATLAVYVVGAVALFGPPILRKLSGNEYATKTDCNRKHEQEEKDCIACKAATKSSICSIQHEGAKTRKLLLLIAIRLEIPQEKLEDLL